MEKRKTDDSIRLTNHFTSVVIFIVICLVTIIVSAAYLSYNSGQTIPRFVSILLVLLCYGFVGYLMLIYFSYRILSPFERYKTDMKHISAGKYSKRLNLRTNDEGNVKSFFDEVNVLLKNMEKMQEHNDTLYKHINEWINELNQVLADDAANNEDIKKSISSLEKRLKEISIEYKIEEPKEIQ